MTNIQERLAGGELIPAILQDATSGRVLMLAYMNQEAFSLTIQTGNCHFWSRSRNEIWLKGSTSGNLMHVKGIEVDCDSDSFLIQVSPEGPACHTGLVSCFDTQSVTFTESGIS